MSASNARKLRRAADILERENHGTPGGVGLDGTGEPCFINAIDMAGLNHNRWRHVGTYRWFDRKGHKNIPAAAQRLRDAADREGGCLQPAAEKEKDKRKVRQHMGAVLAIPAVIALILLIHVIVMALLVVGSVVAFWYYLQGIMAFYDWVEEYYDIPTVHRPDWSYALEWYRTRQPVSLPEREPIALPYNPITADQALKDAWTAQPEKEHVYGPQGR